MATLPVWSEKTTSRKWSYDRVSVQSSVDLEFTVTGTDDDWLVEQLIESNIPQTWGQLPYLLYLMNVETEHQGGGIWDITAHYGLSDPNEAVFSFDTTGATAHITHSKETIQKVGNAPDLGGAINFDGDNVKGVDINVPAFAFQETRTIARELLTNAYRNTLFNLTATMNNASFRGFAAGEVLFIGANGSRRGDSDAEITFHFEASPNRAISVGGLGLNKVGFNYAWARDKKQEDSNRIVVQPDGLYEERVYDYGDFSLLGIGTA